MSGTKYGRSGRRMLQPRWAHSSGFLKARLQEGGQKDPTNEGHRAERPPETSCVQREVSVLLPTSRFACQLITTETPAHIQMLQEGEHRASKQLHIFIKSVTVCTSKSTNQLTDQDAGCVWASGSQTSSIRNPKNVK